MSRPTVRWGQLWGSTVVNRSMPLVMVVFIGCLAGSATRADLVLAADDADPIPIFHPVRPAAWERTAARELAAYLQHLSGTAFSVAAVPDPWPDRGVFIGLADPDAVADLGPDDFRIMTADQRLHLVGGSPRGTLYSVYFLLEETWGCRWWSRNEEQVPAGLATLAVPDQNRVVAGDFSIAEVWNREAQSSENQFVFKARTKSTETFSGGHTLYPLLTPHAADHPAIYPMNKQGNRKANKLHFCYLAPGIAEALADALANEVRKRRENVRDVIYFAGMGDWYGGMCECPDCKAVYAEETWIDPDDRKKPGYTATLLRMINRTAEILDDQYPGIRVGTFAYMSLEAPPAVTRPRDNVVIRVPRLRHCSVHAVGECEKNASFLRNLERWVELAPERVYVWDYGANFGHNFMFPFPCLYAMAGNIRLYHQMKVRGVEIQGNYVSTGGDLAVLKNYVWRRLLWNPSIDPDVVLREFREGYYGPGAAGMLDYVATLEASVRGPRMRCASEFDDLKYLTAQVLDTLRAHEAAALAAVGDQEPYRRRVREATASLEAFALWKAGPLAEQADRLIRTDLGDYTYDRALNLLTLIRDASPREWGTGRAYHLSFLPWHGGPLARLTGESIEVVVAPAINGRIRQITFRGTPLLYIEPNARTKDYPQLGGSVVNTGTRTLTIDGEPTARSVRMVGESGIGHWSPATKHRVWQTVALTETDGIEVTVAGRRLPGGGEKRGASTVTVYQAPNDLTRVVVEYRMDAADWQAVELKANQEIALTDLNALRLVFADKGCQVMDQYLAPVVTGATLLADPAKGILTTTVNTAGVALVTDRETPFLQRRLGIQALEP